MNEPNTVTLTLADRITDAQRRIHFRIEALVASKAERKKLGNAKAVRQAIGGALMADAVRMAILEDIIANPPLYGRDVGPAYERKCKELFPPQ